MARVSAPPVSVQAQAVAVRRAAASAALACRPRSDRPNVALRSKQETLRDALVAAARTLAAVEASRQALDMLPAAQRDQLALRLTAMGLTAVRAEGETPAPAIMTGAAHV
jgi:hypothetical protein